MAQMKIEPLERHPGIEKDRREFLKHCMALAGSGIAGCVVLSGPEARAEVVAADDPRLETQKITYPIEDGEMQAYMVRPKGGEKLPAVIVIHEIYGLNPHIEDVARRMALEGFLAIAPDALSPLGGTPSDTQEALGKMRNLDRAATAKNFVAAVEYLRTHPQTTGNVGCTGFCWGGAMTNQVAVNAPELKAAVDQRINAGIPGFEAALKKAGTDYQIHIYEGAQHAFNNDTNPGRYHKEAAELAWKRTVEFFKDKLQ
jgi:carboxymethylenebutenolidase